MENEKIVNSSDCEIYEFETTYEQMLEVHRYAFKEVVLLSIAFSAICFALTLASAIFSNTFSAVAFTGGTVLTLLAIAFWFGAKRSAKSKFEESNGSLDKAVVYEDHIELRTYRNGEETSMIRINSDEIFATVKGKTLCIFKKGMGYIGLPIEIVKEGTMLFNMLFKDGVVRKADVAQNLTLLFKIFTYFSVAAPLIGIYASGDGEIKWWIFAICLVFPITAIAFGAVLISRGIKFKGRLLCNIIAYAAAAMLLLITALGLASSVLNGIADALDYFDSGYSEVGNKRAISKLRDIGIDFVVDESYSYEYKIYDESLNRYVDVVNTTVYIADTDAFCEAVESDERWQGTVKNDFLDVFGVYFISGNGEVWMLFNQSENTYNKLPKASPCDYVAVVFNSRYSYIDIYEFSR